MQPVVALPSLDELEDPLVLEVSADPVLLDEPVTPLLEPALLELTSPLLESGGALDEEVAADVEVPSGATQAFESDASPA